MDGGFVLKGVTFVWDDRKASLNLRKHGISFEAAAEAFFDPFLKVVDASRGDEERAAIIALDKKWNLLVVVHVVMEHDAIRIISARRATRKERIEYED